MTGDDLEGPEVLRIDVERWHYLAVREDLAPLLLGLARFVRSSVPLGSELESLLAALRRRYQEGAASGNGLEPGSVKVLTVTDVALLSDMAPRTVRQSAGIGLPGVRTSAGWVFAEADVEKWLAQRAEKGR